MEWAKNMTQERESLKTFAWFFKYMGQRLSSALNAIEKRAGKVGSNWLTGTWVNPIGLPLNLIALTLILWTLTGSSPSLIASPDEIGTASWYNRKSSSRITANGERLDEKAMTCAHRDFPFGTILEVKNLENSRTIECRVNDRGPAKWVMRKRRGIVDLTPAAFRALHPNLDKGIFVASVRAVRS